jgi:hypothetical protein
LLLLFLQILQNQELIIVIILIIFVVLLVKLNKRVFKITYLCSSISYWKRTFLSPIPILLANLNKNNLIKNYSKVQNTCNNSIKILNKIIHTNYRARLEYRINNNILNEFLKFYYIKYLILYIQILYIISTELVSKFEISKLKIFFNAYKLSFNPLPQLLILNHKIFIICLIILIKTINQSFNSLSFITKYFSNSNSSNLNNIETLELYEMWKKIIQFS